MTFPNALDLASPLPKDWQNSRARFLFREVDDRSVSGQEELLSLTKNGLVPRAQTTEKEARADSLVGYKKCQPGDIVMNKMQAWNGMFGVATLAGIVSPDYTVFRPKSGVDASFYARMFRTPPFVMEFFSRSRGMGTAFLRLNTEDFGEVRVPVPSPKTAHGIQTYLDRETARIDALIVKKERQLALLGEKRQALISHAVTKGLDPKVPMQNCGFEPVGPFPALWRLAALKHVLAAPITDGPHETPEFVPSGIPFASAEAMVDGRIDLNRRRGDVTLEYHAACCRKLRPRRGDIFMCKSGATTGKVAMVDFDEEFSVWSPLALLRANTRMIVPDFLFIALQSTYVRQQVETHWSAGTQPNIGMSAIGDLRLVLPPLDVQHSIAAAVRSASTSKVGEAIQRSIDLLRERRQSLITAAVTGQHAPSAYMPKEVVAA